MRIGYYFTTNGRVGRQTWWLSRIGSFLALLALMILSRLPLLLSSSPEVAAASTFVTILGLITSVMSIIGVLAYIWFNICINGKRWHDRDKSAWFMLFGAIPLVNIWVLIENGFLRGTEGPNRFGSDPLES
jgi:uncharacterized membrane protein YhaH (DUF805 family)